MADFNLSIANLFERAFGTDRGGQYSVPDQTGDPVVREYEQPDTAGEEGTEFVSVRNALNARSATGQALFMPMAIGGVLLPNEPTVSFRRPKHIVTTKMVGAQQPGEVKELIALGDWKITIRGIALNQQRTAFYPEDTVREIHELAERPEALEVECALTSLLGIYSLVIEEISFPEMIGVQHAQAYELKCVSDRDFTLTID